MNLIARFPLLADSIRLDLRSLALFRITLSLVLLAALLPTFGELLTWWSDSGVLPRPALMAQLPSHRLSLYLANGTGWFVFAMLTGQLLLALMLLLGLRTRLAAVLSFVLWLSLANRNPLITGLESPLINGLLLWAACLPVGARWSIDAALSTTRPPEDNAHASMASAGLLLQITLLCWGTASAQSGSAWNEHVAVAQILSLDHQITWLGAWLGSSPAVSTTLDWLLHPALWLAPLLMLTPLGRRWCVPLGAGLLAIIQLFGILTLQLGLLPWAVLAALTATMPGHVWLGLSRHLPSRPVAIYYDTECAFCEAACLVLREFLGLGQAAVRPAQDTARTRTLMEANDSWVVIDEQEQAHLKWSAFVQLLRASPWLRWSAPLAVRMTPAGDRLYDVVVRHRGRIANLTQPLRARRTLPAIGRAVSPRVSGVLLVLMLLGNLPLARALPAGLYDGLSIPLQALNLDQRWALFAPNPPDASGWLIATGRLADGTETVVLAPDHTRVFDAPSRTSLAAPDLRWRRYYEQLRMDVAQQDRSRFANRLCAQRNAEVTPENQRTDALVSLRMIYLQRTGRGEEAEQQILWRQGCSEDQPLTP